MELIGCSMFYNFWGVIDAIEGVRLCVTHFRNLYWCRNVGFACGVGAEQYHGDAQYVIAELGCNDIGRIE